MSELDRIADELATMAINLGLNIEQIKECLDEAAVTKGEGQTKPSAAPMKSSSKKLQELENQFAVAVEDDGEYTSVKDFLSDLGFDLEGAEATFGMPYNQIVNHLETKKRELIGVSEAVLNQNDAIEVLQTYQGVEEQKTGESTNPFDNLSSFGKTAFGKKMLSKATESVRQIGKKKGIYIVGRKGKKFLGIRFTPKGNYSKNKKGRPNGKMYTLDGLRKMKKKRVSFKKLPQLIDMMDTDAVLKKHKNFKFGFELKKSRCSGFGYSFPVGAGYGKRSALLYGKL
jgi:DNA-binding transcriptional MerR regulator